MSNKKFDIKFNLLEIIAQTYLPWQSLDKSSAKMVEDHRDFHNFISSIFIIVSQKHHLLISSQIGQRPKPSEIMHIQGTILLPTLSC